MHLIRQHTFDIDCPSKNLGKEIHGQLGGLLEQHFYPKLENLLNAYAPHNHTWSIETLELELPDISVKDWKKELVEYSLQQIEKYLIANMPFTQESFKTEDLYAGNIIKNSVQAQALFFTFLKTGTLRENAISTTLPGILDHIEIKDEFITVLIENFKKDIICLIRWIFGIPNVFKKEVYKMYTSFPEHFTALINEVFRLGIKSETISKTESKAIPKITEEWIEFLQWIMILHKQSSQQQQYIKEVMHLSGQHWSVSIEELSSFISKIDTYLKSKSNISKFSNDTKIFFEELNIGIKQVKRVFLKEENSTFKTLNTNEMQNQDVSSFDNAQYIDNAGLVIIHPFLQSLFEQLDLWKDGNWKNENSIHKAILLTQYLVTGQELFFENELLLNKLLCGLELDTVINTKLKITKKDKQKCHSLLTAILEYWKPMNNSSIEALQETFLQRNGKLEQAGSYELWIEERGYDILLAQLPWGITMIKTPWMEEYLTCNWT